MRVCQAYLVGLLLLICWSCTDTVKFDRLASNATCSTPSGVLDTTFGTSGARQIDDPANVNAGDKTDDILAMTLDSSGNIFSTGRTDDEGTAGPPEWSFLISKHNGSTGALDTTFGGGDGVINISSSTLNSTNERGQDIAILSTGEIVAVGALGPGSTDLIISKWNSIGTVETRVTLDGSIQSITGCATGVSQDDEAKAIVLDSSDNFYITGFCEDETGNERGLIVVKTNSSGVVDTTFNTSVGANGYYIFGGEDATNEEGRDILRDSSGNIIVLGVRGLVGDTNSDTLLFKLNGTNGELDTTWGGGDGIVDDSTKGQINRGVIDSSGNIYAVGRSHNGSNWDMTIWRYTSTGVLDTSWGTGGEIDFNLGGDEWARDVEIDSCGNLIIFGFIDSTGAGRDDTAIWRYTSTGSLDTSFGSGNGYVTNTLSTGNNDRANTGVIDTSSNKYITGGSIRTDAADNSCTNGNLCDLYLTKWE